MFETPASRRAAVVADFTRSELFERTFQEGMDLVEETAGYLDGSGRQESKHLSRGTALSYAAQSMRLTTRLMQVASWLLVQRAVREGNMPPENACDDRYRLAGETADRPETVPGDLPHNLTQLLFERVRHLDHRMYVEPPQEEAPNAVASQLDRLRSAFGG
jgi:regulator of CtrA degradation